MKSMEEDYYDIKVKTGYSFEERTGDPDSFSSGIGRIVLSFSELETQLSKSIIQCLELDDKRGLIVTSELSFKNKVHLLTSLIRHMSSVWKFNTGDDDQIESWKKVSTMCFRSEHLRNQIMHSEWSRPYITDLKVDRIKVTAKARKGLHKQIETLDSGDMLDISDYIITVAYFVREFFPEISSNK